MVTHWFNRMMVSVLPFVPKPIVRWIARRYVAGETLLDMINTVRRLNREGLLCTVDLLGEFITDIEQAYTTADHYKQILQTIFQERLQTGISVKLTALGLLLNKETCYQLMREVVAQAAAWGLFVRIDMEDSSCTSDTLDIYLLLRREFTHVGIVLQSYLRRTLGDARQVMEAGAGNFRLCKGIYVEPREVAYRHPDMINRNYVLVLEEMIKRGAYVGIATHDEVLVWEACRLIDQYRLQPDQYEFQMLLGVDEQLRSMILAGGHKVRVYVPFGQQWYAYSLRRLKENPTIAGYVFQSVIQRLVGRKSYRQPHAVSSGARNHV